MPSAADFMEFGVIGDLPFTGWGRARELIDTSEVTVQDLRKMYRADGQVRSIYRILSLPIRTLNPVFTPRPGLEGGDGEEEAKFVSEVFTRPPAQGGMSSSFGRLLTGMTKALADGFAAFEKVWQITPDNKVTYRKFAPRDATSVKFKLDETGGLVALRQRVNWQGKYIDVDIPADKLLIYTAQHEENPWYGESYLLPAYFTWDTKKKLQYIANIAYQFHAVPGRIGTYPGEIDPKQKDAFRKALAEFGFNTAMTKPLNYTVEEFGGKTQIPNFKEIFDYYDTQMAKSVLVQFIQLGTGSNTGSWSLSSDQSDLFTMALGAIADEMAETLALYAIPQLVDYNFTTSAYPDVTLGPLADETKTLMKEVFTEIVDATSVNATPEFLFELEARVAEELDLPIDYEKLRKLEEARREEQRSLEMAAQQAMMEMSQNPPQTDEDDPESAGGNGGGQSVAASEILALDEALRRRRSARRR